MGGFIRSIVRRKGGKGKSNFINMGIKLGLFKRSMVMAMVPMEMSKDHLANLFWVHSYLFQSPVNPLILLLIRARMMVTISTSSLAHSRIHHDLFCSAINIPSSGRNINPLPISSPLS
jgi:hypothetical protein